MRVVLEFIDLVKYKVEVEVDPASPLGVQMEMGLDTDAVGPGWFDLVSEQCPKWYETAFVGVVNRQLVGYEPPDASQPPKEG